MATLAFNVQADFDSLVRLRQEVQRLQAALDNLNGVGTPDAIQALQTQLGAAQQAFTSAAQSAATLGQSLTTNVADLSFGNIDDQIQLLTLAIHDSEAALANGLQTLQQWQTEGEAALSAGDTAHVAELTDNITSLALSLTDVKTRMEGYQAALDTITAGTVDSSMQGVTNALTAISDATARNDAAISQLSHEYDTLDAALQRCSNSADASTLSTAQTAIQGEVATRKQLNSELQAQAAQLTALQPQLQGTVGQVEQQSAASDTLRTRIRALREEMAQLVAQGIDQQSEAYRNLTAELGRLQDIQGDISRQGSILANDERQYAGIQSGLQGVTSAFMAAQGAMLLFGDANNSLQPLLQKTAAVMAIVNSLQQVSQMLNKDSAFRLVTLANAQDYWNKLLAVGRGEQTADNAAKVANTAATTANTVAVEAQTIAKGSNSKANVANTATHTANTAATTAETTATITLTGAVKMAATAMKDMVKAVPVWGWVLAAVGAVTAGITALIKKVKESNKTIQTAALSADEAAKKIAEDIYKPIGSIQLLREQWQRLGDDMQAKQKFIKDNADTFKALKLSIDTVADAERVLIDNTDAYVNAMVQRAKANILATQVEDDVKTIAELEQRLEGMSKTRRTIATFWSQDEINDEYTSVERELAQRKQLLQDLVKSAADANEAAKKAETAAGITTTTTTTTAATTAPSPVSSTTTARDYSKDTARYKELVASQGKERARAAVTMEQTIQQAQIDAMTDGRAKTLAQIDHDFEMQQIAIEQWYEDLTDEKIKDAKALWDANPDTKGQPFDATTVDITPTKQEQQLYATQTAQNERQRMDSIQRVYQAERDAMNAFLKDYGTYEERRQAIAEEYAAKIAAANTIGEQMTLTTQRDQELRTIDIQFADTTDWATILSHVDQYSKDYLTKLQGELQAMLADETITLEQAKTLSNALATVNKQLVDRGNSFATAIGLGNDRLKEQKKLSADLLAVQQQLNVANREQLDTMKKIDDVKKQICELIEGKVNLDVTVDSLTPADSTSIIPQLSGNDSKQATDLFSQFASLSAQSQNLTSVISSLGGESAALTGAMEGAAGAAGGAAGAAGGGAAAAIAMVDTIVHGINDTVQGVQEMLEMFNMQDSKFGEGWSEFAKSSQYATDAWDSLKSGDMAGVAVGVVGSLKTLESAIGKWTGLWGETDPKLHDDMESLKYSNEALQHSVDELSDVMIKSSTSLSQATEDYETAKKNLEQMEKDTASIMQRAGVSHSIGIFNSDHSSNYYVNDNMTARDWEAVSAAVGRSVTSASDFWKLTSEEMYNVSVQAAAQYAKIKQYADDGHDDAAQYMDDYINLYKELNDLQDSYNEKLTSTSYDSLLSSFQSAIMDMEHTSADFANDFEELMQNAVVSSLMSSKYASMLDDWYKTFASYMENDQQLTTQERDALKAEYDAIVDQATKEVKEIYDMMGWNTNANTQVAQSTAWQTLSEDTGQELNGRFTALQEAAYNILDVDRAGQVTFDELLTLAQTRTDSVVGIRQAIAQAYLELQGINDNTAATVRVLTSVDAHLTDISNNTDRL